MSDKFLGTLNPSGISPFLSLLPSFGSVAELEKYSPSFFARHEKAVALKAALTAEGEVDNLSQLNAEIDMLKTVLDWLNNSAAE